MNIIEENSNSSNYDETETLATSGDEVSSHGLSWTEDWEHTCWDEPEFRFRRSVSPPMVFEYTGLKLEMLPKPQYMIHEQKDEDTWGIAFRRGTVSPPKKRLILEEPVVIENSPPKTPWAKIDMTAPTKPHDPWAFLEEKKAIPPLPPNRRPPTSHFHSSDRRHNHHNHQQSSPTTTTKHPNTAPTKHVPNNNNNNDNITPDPSKLCKYKDQCRMNKNGRCTMVHTLKEWKPRLCKFNTRCNRKTQCGYYHQDQNTREFLVAMLKKKDSIYEKNSTFYEKYVK
jgi:hypothetical protein